MCFAELVIEITKMNVVASFKMQVLSLLKLFKKETYNYLEICNPLQTNFIEMKFKRDDVIIMLSIENNTIAWMNKKHAEIDTPEKQEKLVMVINNIFT